jgi:hypothetical protein
VCPKVANEPDRVRPERLVDLFNAFLGVAGHLLGEDHSARSSGCSGPTFYKHFPRKDDLVLAYLDKVDQTLLRAHRTRGLMTSPRTLAS